MIRFDNKLVQFKVGKMPGDDGLPSYDEVMGFERVLPQNISREIIRQISDTNNGERSSSNKCGLALAGLIFFVVYPILGFFMIIVGYGNLYVCYDTMLPKWLFVGGSSIEIFYILFILFCIGFCTRDESDRFATSSGLQTFSTSLMTLDVLFGVVWYGLGCYWSWSAKLSAFEVSRKDENGDLLTFLETPQTSYEDVDVTAGEHCDVSVYWLALGVTISPFILALIIGVFLCITKRATEPSETVS